MSADMPTFNELGSASHGNLFAHVVGPLRQGARAHEAAIGTDGRVDVSWAAREPLVGIVLLRSLGAESLRVALVRDPAGDDEPLPPLWFASYTEFGATLPGYLPSVDAVTRHAAPFTLALQVTRIDSNGAEHAIAAAATADWLRVEVLEGVLARVAYVLGSEHMRMRRVMREISAMRRLASARDSALDRIGAELAVPRFTDDIDYDDDAEEVLTRSTDPGGQAILESDAAYRRRLSVYRPRLYLSMRGVLGLLNGPGEPGDPNRGPLGELGLRERFQLVEEDNPFAFALHLVATGADATRTNFLAHLRRVLLIAPRRALEQDRFLSSRERDRQQALRERLNESFEFDLDDHVAPMLAEALERVARCRASLLGGALAKRKVLRAQDAGGGSRYELGLGVDLQPLTVAERTALHDALLAPDRRRDPDIGIEGLLRKMAALPPPAAGDDADAAWFFRACGLRTVHRINNSRIYVSHLPTAGLVIEGVSSLAAGDETTLSAHYHAPGDSGANVRLVESLAAAAAGWAEAAGEAWSELPHAQARDRWANAVLDADAAAVFAATGLPAIDPAADRIADRLDRVAEDLLATLRLGPAQAAEILGGAPEAAPRLTNLKRTLAEAGVVSLLPLATNAAEVVLVCGVIGLPGVGANVGPRRAAGFRWYSVPIEATAGVMGSIGSRPQYEAGAAPALTAVVAVGYARDPALTDPYEFRVQLPEGTRLDLHQYEFLMNVLDYAHPAGVEVNTWRIRQHHVDLDGDDAAEPVSPNIARSYRQFRRLRHRGEFSVGIEE